MLIRAFQPGKLVTHRFGLDDIFLRHLRRRRQHSCSQSGIEQPLKLVTRHLSGACPVYSRLPALVASHFQF